MVVSNTVKDVLTELCDDNLVQREKIGSSWYYWSFPSSIGAAVCRSDRQRASLTFSAQTRSNNSNTKYLA